MLIATFVEKVYFVGSGDGNGGVDGHVGDGDADDALVVALEVLDLGLREEAHINDLNFKTCGFKSLGVQLYELGKMVAL